MNHQMNCNTYLLWQPNQGLREGAEGTMTSGPMEFRRPIRGLIEMTLTNQFVEDRRLFLEITQNPENIVPFCLEDLFFLDHIKIRRKLCHFPILFWTTQNQSCIIFDLTPDPRLALGTSEPNHKKFESLYLNNLLVLETWIFPDFDIV